MEQVVATVHDRRALARDAIAYFGAGIAAIFAIGCALDHMPIAALLMVAAIVVAIRPVRRTLARRGLPRAMRIALPIGLVLAGCLALGAQAPVAKPDATGAAGTTRSPAPAAGHGIDNLVSSSPGTVRGTGLTQQAASFWSGIKVAVRPCDVAWDKAAQSMTGDAMMGDNVYTTHHLVKVAADACGRSADTIAQSDLPPSAEGEDRDNFNHVLAACEDAYSGAALSFNLTIDILDGDHRPSFVDNVKQKMEAAGRSKVACVSRMMTALDGAGLPTSIIKK